MKFLKLFFDKPHILPSEQNILDFLSTKKNCKISKGDIIRALNVDDDCLDDFSHLLKSMRKRHLIVKSNGNTYHLADSEAVDDISEVNATINDALDNNVYIGIITSQTHNDYGKKIIIYGSKNKKSYHLGDKVVIKIKKSAKKKRYGKIFTPKEDRPPMTTGIIRKTFYGLEIVPTNKKQKWVHSLSTSSNDIQPEHGDLVKFTVSDTYSKHHKSNVACVTDIIHRKVNDIKSISIIALEDNYIPYVFPPEVTAESDIIPEISIQNDTYKRIDLTDFPFITIDPKDARDHDDAVFTQLTPNGGAMIYVAIADVSAYVTPDSHIDKQATLRGNSIYLPDRVVPMLPERLSNNLCSLRANTTRPVLVAKIEINENGQKTHHEFIRAFIHCKANLTYEDVYEATKNPNNAQFLRYQDTILKPLIQTYELLKIAHEKRAPLDLDLPEYKIMLDADKNPTHVAKKDRLFTHRLIEEFMILANVCAAQTLEEYEIPVVYRSHDIPPADKIASLNETLKAMRIPFKSKTTINSRMFNKLLHHAKETETDEIIAKMVLRCQCQAVYTPDNQGHFGLNLEKYAHFTSPIRRYADLLVHRSLIKVLGLGNDGITDDELSRIHEICEHISKTERRAITAEMETKDRFLAELLKSKISEHFKARISGVTNAGLFVRLPEYGAEGFIPITNLSQFSKQRRYFETNETRHILRDKYSRQYYILGQIIHVTLLDVNLFTGGMTFSIIDDNDLNAADTLVHQKKEKKKFPKKKISIEKEIPKNKHKNKDKQKLF